MKYTLVQGKDGPFWLCETDDGEPQALPVAFKLYMSPRDLPIGTAVILTLPAEITEAQFSSPSKSRFATFWGNVRLRISRILACFCRKKD